MEIQGNYFLANYLDVLYKIQQETPYLADIKELSHDIMITCPFHKQGQEEKPSCGITLEPKRRGSKMTQEGTVHCFTCNTTVSFETLISHCYGYDDGGAFGLNYLFKYYSAVAIEDRMPLKLYFEQEKEAVSNWSLTEEQLKPLLRYRSNYLDLRRIKPDVQVLFEIGYNQATREVIFPIRDSQSQLVGTAKRSVDTKRYRNEFDKGQILYGLHLIYKCLFKVKKLYIVEGLIDCLTLWSFGIPAVALCGAHATDTQIALLNALPIRHMVIMLDNFKLDEAGLKGAQYLQRKLNHYSTFYHYSVDKKDANDLTFEEFSRGTESIALNLSK